jgi:hypothetical protein
VVPRACACVAIANRFVVLAMHESFLGKENTSLTQELTTELTGILSHPAQTPSYAHARA